MKTKIELHCECGDMIETCHRTTPIDKWKKFRRQLTIQERMDGFIVRKDCPNHPKSEYTILREMGDLVLVVHND